MIGSTAALVSNFPGAGPWLPGKCLPGAWPEVSAGVVNITFSHTGSKGLALFVFYGVSVRLDNEFLVLAPVHPLTWKTLSLTGSPVWFDTFHALTNAVFYLF